MSETPYGSCLSLGLSGYSDSERGMGSQEELSRLLAPEPTAHEASGSTCSQEDSALASEALLSSDVLTSSSKETLEEVFDEQGQSESRDSIPLGKSAGMPPPLACDKIETIEKVKESESDNPLEARVSASSASALPSAMRYPLIKPYHHQSSTSVSMESSGVFCRICHCESPLSDAPHGGEMSVASAAASKDGAPGAGAAEQGVVPAQELLISPCHCSGTLKYVHQTCLQKWIKSGQRKRCELCNYEFEMTSQIKPFRQWKKLNMSTVERRKVLCSVTFHVVAITCVIWSLYVLIDRTRQEVNEGKLHWPFWTKLVVVAIGFTGGLVFMYVQCKMYVQLFRKWKDHNRVIYILEHEMSEKAPSPQPSVGATTPPEVSVISEISRTSAAQKPPEESASLPVTSSAGGGDVTTRSPPSSTPV